MAPLTFLSLLDSSLKHVLHLINYYDTLKSFSPSGLIKKSELEQKQSIGEVYAMYQIER